MKQVLQDLKTGEIVVADVPDPQPCRGRLLVRVEASLLSAGTESAMIAQGEQSLLEKLRQKPELLRKGLEEFREHGVAGIREKLASKFGGFTELGYSCTGVVVDAGEESVAPGTRVACAGAGLANHAELVSVPRLLTAVVPEGISPESAAYTTVGAIALQGVRQAGLQLGETVAVIGLGLVGLLSVQLVRAAGCRVLGIDPSEKARQRAQTVGCDAVAAPNDAAEAILSLSEGLGADAVIICAATAESSPVELAGRIARSRGRVVMVGATGMTIPRQDYYLKELSFVLSRSYGPGRYDRNYEEGGQDYPLDYVRFTEQRNMQAFLELVRSGRLDLSKITTHRFPVGDAPAAYALLKDPAVERVGIVLTYPTAQPGPARFSVQLSAASASGDRKSLGIGFIGAGAYAQAMLLPLLSKRPDIALTAVMTRNGTHALQVARRFGFGTVCTSAKEVLENRALDLVFVSTRHDSHAEFAIQALRAGKHVWVEKPLALSLEELKQIAQALREHPTSRLVVGFNRPFSQSASWLHKRLAGVTPKMMLYRVNAGMLEPSSWIHDPKLGGGRLLGEGCHFFDFLRHTAGAPAELVTTEALRTNRTDLPDTANFATTIRFSNGSVGQVLYSSHGARGMSKERFECFGGQACGVIDDFREAEFFHQGGSEKCARHKQDKGQAGLIGALVDSLRAGSKPPIDPADSLESSLITLAAQQSLLLRQPIQMSELRGKIV